MNRVHESNQMPDFPQFNRQKQCRYGTMLYNIHDTYIGRSLDEYGEFSEGEVDVFRQAVKPGQIVLEVGANIGTHTVWFSQAVGPTGSVLAFEPQRIVFQTLCANLALNSLTNVHCFCVAAGSAPGQITVPILDQNSTNNFGGLGLGSHPRGELTPMLTIDGLNLSACHFLKIDVEGMEHDVLMGATKTIAAHSPILYVENDRPERAEALIRLIDSFGYNMFWHRPPLFNPGNFSANPQNIFGNIVSINMLCLPKAISQQISGFQQVEVPSHIAATP